ncbi:MAG: hypothetical protein JXL84_14245 [Deltaproteobacteria bacterium]|nr:hypothetical protein [Deltaproteobacteria bacterium]
MEICPRCREICNMIMTASTRIVRAKNQQMKRIKTRSFHCEKCGQYVRSEDLEEKAIK